MPDSMRSRLLGRSGLRVSELCMGTMTFGTEGGFGAEDVSCREIYAAFRVAGGIFLDTADVYHDGASERIVGRLVSAERDAVVLGAKCTLPTDRNDPNSAAAITRACAAASRKACAGWSPTASTCCACTPGTSTPPPRRPCGRSTVRPSGDLGCETSRPDGSPGAAVPGQDPQGCGDPVHTDLTLSFPYQRFSARRPR